MNFFNSLPSFFTKKKHKENNVSQTFEPYELTKEEMLLKTSLNSTESAKNIIGPLFVFGGGYGLIKGIFQTFKTNLFFPNRNQRIPKKFIITTFLNNITEQSLKYANAAGGLGLVFCFTRQTINFFFEEKMKKMNNLKRNTLIGIASGMIYKSTRGFAPAMLGGFVMGNCCFALTYYINYRHMKRKKILSRI